MINKWLRRLPPDERGEPLGGISVASTNIEPFALGDLKPWARLARIHSKKQLRQIADRTVTFGLANPVLIEEDRV